MPYDSTDKLIIVCVVIILNSYSMDQDHHKKIKIWDVRVYIINGRVKRKKLGDRSNRGYLMEYAATTGVIIFWNPYQKFVIHRYYHVWFDDYNYRLPK